MKYQGRGSKAQSKRILAMRSGQTKGDGMDYEATFEVRIGGRLADHEMERLREAMLKALDEANLPYKADVVTGSVRPL